MTVDPETATYRYHVHSEPPCGLEVKRIDVHAKSRADADLQMLATELRLYETHARHCGAAYDWTIRDRHGLLLISATTSPEGTTYH